MPAPDPDRAALADLREEVRYLHRLLGAVARHAASPGFPPRLWLANVSALGLLRESRRETAARYLALRASRKTP